MPYLLYNVCRSASGYKLDRGASVVPWARSLKSLRNWNRRQLEFKLSEYICKLKVHARILRFWVGASCYTLISSHSRSLPFSLSLSLSWFTPRPRARIHICIGVHTSKAAPLNKAFTLSGRVSFTVEICVSFRRQREHRERVGGFKWLHGIEDENLGGAVAT